MTAHDQARRALADYLRMRLERLRQCNSELERKLSDDRDALCRRVDKGEIRRDDPVIGRVAFHLEYVLGNTFRYTLLVGVCSFLEEAVKEITKLRVADYDASVKKEQGKKGSWLDKHVRVLSGAGVDLAPVGKELQDFGYCITLRNCIVHSWGKVAEAKDQNLVETAASHVESAAITKDGYLALGDVVVAFALYAAEEIVLHLN
jgi:hypothetical protein